MAFDPSKSNSGRGLHDEYYQTLLVLTGEAAALARLAKEVAGGPAQEIITERGGVATFLAVHYDPACTEACRASVAEALRLLLVYKPAKEEMRDAGVLRRVGMSGVDLVL